MKKKIRKGLAIILFITILSILVVSTYTWIRTGNQKITITTPSKVYAQNKLYINVKTEKNGELLENKSTVKLLNSKGEKVKGTKCEQKGNEIILNVPKVDGGKYYLRTTVTTKAGKDKIEKEIYITDKEKERINISLDKGVYKPGDLIKFRILTLKKDNDKPLEKDINISIYDGKENRVYKQDVKSSEFGISSGEFKLADELNSGNYKIMVKTNSTETTKTFKVNPYVIPKYEAKITFDKKSYVLGDTVKLNVKAMYFFGEPVKNAKVNISIDDKNIKEVNTDSDGNAKIDYKPNSVGQHNVKVELKDQSNYYIEEKSNFSVGTDLFEIELLPEYSKLANNRKNKVHVLTRNVDGTPLKAYVTISSDNFTKQIVTDENGIGSFYIDVDGNKFSRDTYNSNFVNFEKNQRNHGNKKFTVAAKNMQNEEVKKSIFIEIEDKETVFKTDKVKYNQNEDIKIDISSFITGEKKIYAFKNDKLVKSLSTNTEETTLNLGNQYGLIDLYILNNKDLKDFNYYKRTIFIKPKKALNIEIKSDKEQYKPGENIKLTFETKNAENKNVESALLINMIDNAILKLADNDMSIDNVKLALLDLDFLTQEDVATLYSCIIDNKSEATMQALLLKQNSKNINLSNYTDDGKDIKDTAKVVTIAIIILVALIVIILLSKKYKKFKTIVHHVINSIICSILFFSLLSEIASNNDHTLYIAILAIILGVAAYLIGLIKIGESIFRTTTYILISLVGIFLFNILWEISEKIIGIIILFLAILLLIYAIIRIKLAQDKEKFEKCRKIIKKISEKSKYIILFIVIEIFSYLVWNLLDNILSSSIVSSICSIILIYLLNHFINNIKTENKKIKIAIKIILFIIIVIGTIIVLFLIAESRHTRTYR